MTAQQMKYEFEVGYDSITNFEAPGYKEKEISTFLTKAQEELVLDLYRNGNHYKEEFKKSLTMLKTVQTAIANINPGTDYPSSFTVELNTDVLAVYNESVNLLTEATHFYPSTSITDVEVDPVDDDFYHANKNNPFKCPTLERVWRLDDSTGSLKRHIYITQLLTAVVKAVIHYYKKPSPIIIAYSGYVAGDGAVDGINFSAHTVNSLDCALDPLVHRQIVDRAIKLAYAAIQDEKGFQISTIQEQGKIIKS